MAVAVDIFGILLLLAVLAAVFWIVRLIVGIVVSAIVCLFVLFVVMSFWVPGSLLPVQDLLRAPLNFVLAFWDQMREAARVVTG